MQECKKPEVKLNHRCKICRQTRKDGVHFCMRKPDKKWYIDKTCSGCRYDKYVGRRSRLRFKPKTIQQRIKDYFDERKRS